MGKAENEIIYSMYQRPNDWMPVGTYYFEKGRVRMKLYDRGAFPGQLIFCRCGEVGKAEITELMSCR